MKIAEEILREPTFHIKQNFPLKNLTTIGVGGNASFYSEIDDLAALSNLIDLCQKHKTPFLVIGSGSNLLISDQGLDLLVIHNKVTNISITNPTPNTCNLTVAAGTPLQTLVDFTIQHGLAGLEKLTGIPGTVGGAIFGNAGAYGQTISDHLTSVTTRHHSRNHLFDQKSCQFTYRHSLFKSNHQPIISATFLLPTADTKTLQQQSRATLITRLQKYPPGLKCPGSFFKNLLVEDLPPQILNNLPNLKDYYGKVPAWYFLQSVGAKGMHIGGAAVSNIHANLIENTGNATAQDFYDLTSKLQSKVARKFGITLHPEVQILGDFTTHSAPV